MKKWTFFLAIVFVCTAAQAGEVGMLFGGGVDLDDSYDAISFTPFYSGTREHNGQPLHFFSPLTFNLGVNLPGNLKTYAIQYTPGLEYDVRLVGNELFAGPILAAGVFYQRTTGGAVKLNQLGVALVPAVQVKYLVSEHFIVRAIPFQMSFIPWTYTDNGVGSDILLAVQYQAMVGVSYMF